MKTCFLVMPIRESGTAEHEHFRTVRETLIKPALVDLGYEVIRADDISQSGDITKDMVELLANSELVVADLTDLNPNVFYELGARHALRKNGTIMLVDETRTSIPFDLQPFRTIKYQPTLIGAELVRAKLSEYASSMDPDGGADNPIHAHLPSLPADVNAHALGSAEGTVRRQIDELRRRLVRYEREYGVLSEGDESIFSMVGRLSAEVRGSSLPQDLMASAKEATQARDVGRFIEVVERMVSTGLRRLSGIQFIELASWASALNLGELEEQLYIEGQRVHPNDPEFERMMLASQAHSLDPAVRKIARDRYEKLIGLQKVADGSWQLPDRTTRRDLASLGVMLDTYHRDKLHRDALQIAQRMVRAHPDSDIALRNFARALEYNDRLPEAIAVYRAALAMSDVGSAASASWLGNTLFTQKRRVDALEVYAAAAMLDPDDGEHFLDMAHVISLASDAGAGGKALPFLARREGDADCREMPPELASEEVTQTLGLCALCCPDLDADDYELAQRLFSAESIETMLRARSARETAVTRTQRRQVAERIYAVAQSPLTLEASATVSRAMELAVEDT